MRVFVCAWHLRSDLPEKTLVSCSAASQASAHIYFLWKISNTDKGPLAHSCSQILTPLSWRPAGLSHVKVLWFDTCRDHLCLRCFHTTGRGEHQQQPSLNLTGHGGIYSQTSCVVAWMWVSKQSTTWRSSHQDARCQPVVLIKCSIPYEHLMNKRFIPVWHPSRPHFLWTWICKAVWNLHSKLL